jgi:hypothetical protein
MDLFSYRHGIKKNPDTFQTESISDELRNRLWTCLFNRFFSKPYSYDSGFGGGGWIYPEHRQACELIWDYYFKDPIDNLENNGRYANDVIRKYFFNAKWDEVYSFIEFCERLNRTIIPDPKFSQCINSVLEEEFAGYRLIDVYITPITDKMEIDEINKSLTIDAEINEHLQTALKFLSDKKNPNYRNSIKESISAVEALCKKIENNPNVTLGDALNKIERSGKIEFHRALKAGFSSLYGWTSGADGIRHAMMDSKALCQEDARFMLVACSAFANYLKIKVDKEGIKIN